MVGARSVWLAQTGPVIRAVLVRHTPAAFRTPASTDTIVTDDQRQLLRECEFGRVLSFGIRSRPEEHSNRPAVNQPSRSSRRRAVRTARRCPDGPGVGYKFEGPVGAAGAARRRHQDPVNACTVPAATRPPVTSRSGPVPHRKPRPHMTGQTARRPIRCHRSPVAGTVRFVLLCHHYRHYPNSVQTVSESGPHGSARY